MDPSRLFILADNQLLRDGLMAMFLEQPDFAVVGSVVNSEKALVQIKEVRPHVVMIDIGMPDNAAIEVTKLLRRDASDTRVIVMGMCDDPNEIMECIEAGISGYVLKETSFDQLLETLRAVVRGESNCTPELAAALFKRITEMADDLQRKASPEITALTNREVEVLDLVSVGMTNKAIGQQLFIETQTVKNHVHNVLEKLNLHNRTEAVAYARAGNLLNTESGSGG